MRRVELGEGEKTINVYFPYSPGLVTLVKTVPGGRFKPGEVPRWEFPPSSFAARKLRDALLPLNFDITPDVSRLALEDQRLLKAKEQRSGKIYDERLFDFQRQAIDFLNAAKGRAIIADQMGLGKTIETIAWWDQWDGGRLLVVSPAIGTYKWAEELDIWSKEKRNPIQVIDGYTAPFTKFRAGTLICSYNVMTKRHEELLDWADCLVLDEFHYVKGRPSGKKYKGVQRVDAAIKLAESIPYLLGLSGTPFWNRPIEMFNMLHMVDPAAWDNVFSYGYRYCGGRDFKGHMFVGSTNTEELRERLATVMIRRLKDEVLADLPDLTRTLIPIDIGNLKEYARTERDIYEELVAMKPGAGFYNVAFREMARLRYIIGQGKAIVAADWANDFLSQSDERLVLAIHHKDVANYLANKLEKWGTVKIVGDTPQDVRLKFAKRFQNLDKIRVAIISLAGGEAIDLFSENGPKNRTILFIERQWTPGQEEQIESRLHRLGQKENVTAYYLMARKTIDEKMATLVERKREVFRKLVDLEEIETTVMQDLLAEFVK